MRKPKIENKYNLKFDDIKSLVVVDRSKICKPLFWRNDVINAWCISREIGTAEDVKYGSNNEAWIGIYDKKFRRHYVHCRCYAWGGMCHYNFKNFFDPNEIENELDLQTQEFVLSKINELIDKSILALPEKNEAKKGNK